MQKRHNPKAHVTDEFLEKVVNRFEEVVDDKLDKKFFESEKRVGKKLDEKLAPIKHDVKKLQASVNGIQADVVILQKGMTDVKDDLKELAYHTPTKQEFDSLRHRVDRLERVATRN